MSSKKKKSEGQWVSCDNCHIIISQNDVEKHSSDCPTTNSDYPYISHRKLYVPKLELYNSKDASFRFIPPPTRDDLVLLSPICLQLTQIYTVDSVLVHVDDHSFILTAWQHSDKPILSCYISEEKAQQNMIQSGCQAVIEPLDSSAVRLANRIIVKTSSLLSNFDFLALLKQNYIEKIVQKGDRLFLKYFGRSYMFVVMAIYPEGANFFRVTDNTTWALQSEMIFKEKHVPPNEIAGLESQAQQLLQTIKLSFDTTLDIPYKSKGVIVYGPKGVGKSSLLAAICHDFSTHFILKNDTDVTEVFQKAAAYAPSIILINNLEEHCGKTKTFASALAAQMDEIDLKNQPVVVLASTNNLTNIDNSLKGPGRFDREIEIWVPNAKQRFEILKCLLKPVKHELTDEEIKLIADTAHGLVGADLFQLVSESVLETYAKGITLNFSIMKEQKGRIKPSAIKEVLVEVPTVKWDDVGGLKDLKLKLKQTVEWPLKHPESFRRLGLTPLKGLLMYGPPGCSKTMIAKALATESGVNFISVKGPELFSKWVGESEKAVREVFRRARQAAPSIIFFDELDALGGERGSSSSGSNVQDRVLAQLLTELDGIEALESVIIVGATNRLDRIDSALLRPGRLDRIVLLSLPDEDTRREIFLIQARKMSFAKNVDIELLVKRSVNFSGAEVVALCREAALHALECDLYAEQVTMENFNKAFLMVTPRTPELLSGQCVFTPNNSILN